MVYVDDIAVTGSNSSHVQSTIKLLDDMFSIKDLGSLHFFLGAEVLQHAHGLVLTRSSFIADLLERFGMLDANSVSTPMSTNDPLSLDDGSSSADAKLYRQIIAKRLLRYLKGIITYGLHFTPATSFKLLAYSDADWGGIPDTRHSTFAYVILLGNNPISWCSKKQHTVARLSTEAEYMVVTSAVVELSWITNLLMELHVSMSSPPKVLCDNIDAT
ncbi:PREDICTED: uncharacterized protein LOC109210376 [Nicotiana attenuata]|uniref:uncharacterized protein LOC109210376 n=1 Tax=Nicotiana attenuata TaxID=49451 RepID=UPI00090467DD|nr:PREDICTED: uncharacterized protein LOC109210376 [Nicotiana attenuata]